MSGRMWFTATITFDTGQIPAMKLRLPGPTFPKTHPWWLMGRVSQHVAEHGIAIKSAFLDSTPDNDRHGYPERVVLKAAVDGTTVTGTLHLPDWIMGAA